jgi:hypothetical protein
MKSVDFFTNATFTFYALVRSRVCACAGLKPRYLSLVFLWSGLHFIFTWRPVEERYPILH